MSERKNLGSVELSADGPTDLTFDELGDWVIWQFPKLKGKWICGAVHPPQAEYGWLPAAIQPLKRCLRIHANDVTPFASPEEAARWLESTGDQKTK
ncbi:MAG: hypothetical protein ACOC9C_02505 [Chloroflexota bacterium]